MVDIDSVWFENFLSYGSYRTTIPLSKLGPCLVTGCNGAGKSTLVNSILYPLFGRTMHSPRPGDRVVNNITKCNCLSSIKMKSGDVITRTRKMSGHNELVVERGGEQLLATVSTTPNQQAQLNRMYDLDWHAFCNTSFLMQVGRTWFDLPEPQRKKEIERALRIDRLTTRAQVAKADYDGVLQRQERIREKHDGIKRQIESAMEDIAEARENHDAFDAARLTKFNDMMEKAREYTGQYDRMEVPDVNELREKWQVIANAKKALASLEEKVTKYNSTIAVAESRQREAARIIKLWRDKSGKVCAACEQEVPHSHSDDKIAPYIAAQKTAKDDVDAATSSRDKLVAKIANARSMIKAEEPTMSVGEAEAIVARKNMLLDTAMKWAEQAKAAKNEGNPYVGVIDKLEGRVAEWQKTCDSLATELAENDVLAKHINYIFKSYNDRKRIKSFAMAKFKPLLNSRLKYYLEKFKLDIGIEITESLGVVTDGADYDFMSGGERTRATVAFMLARFDVQESVYGKQSNVIVLDEVDAKMDEEGVECFADVVLNDLAAKVDAVLVISHKKTMRDVFPNQITIEKHGKLSVIGEMRVCRE